MIEFGPEMENRLDYGRPKTADDRLVADLLRGSRESVGEQGEGDGVGHRFVAGRGGVEVVAAIVGGQEAIGMLRVAHDSVEVDHRVEVARRANPLIHCLPVGLAQRAGMVVA